MTEQELTNNEIFTFESDDHSLEVEYKRTLSHQMMFITTFNGKITKMVLTFKSIEKEVNRLIEKYDLIQVISEDQIQSVEVVNTSTKFKKKRTFFKLDATSFDLMLFMEFFEGRNIKTHGYIEEEEKNLLSVSSVITKEEEASCYDYIKANS